MEMASEESDLVERLVEVGKRLLNPPSDVGELLALLDQAESFLAKVEQSPNESILAALHSSMQSLVAKKLLRYPDMDVKIAVTSCISEITRITAPEPPYDDELMKEIFELIVDALKGLDDDFSGRSYPKRVLILETVAKVRSCLMMLDLECDQLILRMFYLFFKVTRGIHHENVFKAMESIMILILEESEEISFDLAMCLLSSVKKDNKDVSVAKALGETVIQNCRAILKPCLMEAIQSSGSRMTDYHRIVASVCQDNNDKFGSHHPGECLMEDGKLSEGTVAEELPQGSESLDIKAGRQKVGADAEKSPKSITSNSTINVTNHSSMVQAMSPCMKSECHRRVSSSAPSRKKVFGHKMNLEKGLPLEDVKEAMHNHPIGSNKKAGSRASPVPMETSDATRPRRGRPPGSKSRSNKKSEIRNDLEARQLSSSGRKKVQNSNNEHSHKQASKGKQPKKEVNSDKDEAGDPSPMEMTSSKAMSKADKVQSQKAVSKRKLGRLEEKGVALDEKLIGSAIKVWWPEDEEFYRGVVDSFDPSTEKHKILYADGDIEILVLKEERWEFVHSDDSSSGEEGGQDLPQSCPVMSLKKAKSNPGSTKKRARVQTPESGGIAACKLKGDLSAPGKKHGIRRSGEKSKEKTGSMSKETSRKVGKSSEEQRNYEPGTPEASCKLKDDASTEGKLIHNLLSVDGKSMDGIPKSGIISDNKTPKISNNPRDDTQNVCSKAMDDAVNSRYTPENGNALNNPEDVMNTSA